jgi:hypothetical protein
MAVDLSKPKPECDCRYMDAYNSWLCEGCEWQKAMDRQREYEFMSEQNLVTNAGKNAIAMVTRDHLKAISKMIMDNRQQPIQSALYEIEEILMGLYDVSHIVKQEKNNIEKIKNLLGKK